MELQLSDVITWKDEFDRYFEKMRDFFGRLEVQNQGYDYLHGLLAPIEKKLLELGSIDSTKDTTTRSTLTQECSLGRKKKPWSFCIEKSGIPLVIKMV